MKTRRLVAISILFTLLLPGIGGVQVARAFYLEPLGQLAPGQATRLAVLGEPNDTVKIGFSLNYCETPLPWPFNVTLPICIDPLFFPLSLILLGGNKIVPLDAYGRPAVDPVVVIPPVQEIVGMQLYGAFLGGLGDPNPGAAYAVGASPLTVESPESAPGRFEPGADVLCTASSRVPLPFSNSYRPLGLRWLSQFNGQLNWTKMCAPASGAILLEYLSRRDSRPGLLRSPFVSPPGRMRVASTTAATDALGRHTQYSFVGGTDVKTFLWGFLDYLNNSPDIVPGRYRAVYWTTAPIPVEVGTYRRVDYYRSPVPVEDIPRYLNTLINPSTPETPRTPVMLFVFSGIINKHAIVLDDFNPNRNPDGTYSIRIVDPASDVQRIENARLTPQGDIDYGGAEPYRIFGLFAVQGRQ